MENGIQFSVDFPNWKNSKQLAIEEKEDPLSIIQLLQTSTEKLDEMIDMYLKKIGNLNEVDALIAEAIAAYKKGEMKPSIAVLKGTGAMGKAIKPISESNPKWQSKEQKEITQFLKAYATHQFMHGIGMPLNYGAIK